MLIWHHLGHRTLKLGWVVEIGLYIIIIGKGEGTMCYWGLGNDVPFLFQSENWN